MVQKQNIIIRHREGVSNRQIANELGIDKNTVNRYVSEYENALQALLAENPAMDAAVIPSCIADAPRYNTENRSMGEQAKKALPIIEACLAENAVKRATGRSKQQMRKIDIYHYLKKQGIRVSYSTAKRLIQGIDERKKEAYIRQEHLPGEEVEFDWGEVKLDIGGTGYMYLHTLGRKPGSLARSSALLQADEKIKDIYDRYYSSDPKTFLTVLELIGEIRIDSVENALAELLKKVHHDLSAEKLRLVHQHLNETSNGNSSRKEDKLSRRAKSTLQNYDRLRALQSGRTVS